MNNFNTDEFTKILKEEETKLYTIINLLKTKGFSNKEIDYILDYLEGKPSNKSNALFFKNKKMLFIIKQFFKTNNHELINSL